MENAFNRQEFEQLKKQYGKGAQEEDFTFVLRNEGFFNEVKHNTENDRRGEVAFIVKRPNSKLIVVRTSFYPEGIYRIPTGGINYGENIIEALYREVKEELGLDVQIDQFLGVIKYHMFYKEKKVDFYSYIFLVREIGGNILVDALEDEVSQFKEVDKKELMEVVNALQSMEGNWKDWCYFRAQTTRYALKYI